MSDINVPTTETGKRMLASVSPIYDRSYVARWLFEVMGIEMEEARQYIEELRLQAHPKTATWGLFYWEMRYHIPIDESLPIEYRRQKVMSKRWKYAPMNPARMEEYINRASGRTAIVTEYNDEYRIETALQSGCLVLSTNTSGQIWIEQGINTLVTPSGNQDAGWKKIRRVKTRFELIDRVNDTVAPLIGKVNNDSDGRAAIIAGANGVIKRMIGEKKLLSGNCMEDPSNPAAGDSAWFIIAVDDIDSIERAYLTFRFRFSADE
jgi:hypothetical protein